MRPSAKIRAICGSRFLIWLLVLFAFILLIVNIQYCSDLHLEFRENKNFLAANKVQPAGELLLLAGDIVPFLAMERHKDFFDYIADHFEQTYWIPGNHEYYQFDLDKVDRPLNEKIRSNISLVDNQVIRYKQVNILCTTLWSHIQPQHATEVEQGVTDFHVIRKGSQKLDAYVFNHLHETSLAFLETALQEHAGEQNIIMTHHVPTMQRYPVFFRDSPINDAFAVELKDFIETCGASHWLYGHHHCNVGDFVIGNTTMITNQLGYVHEGQHKRFRRDAVIQFEGLKI